MIDQPDWHEDEDFWLWFWPNLFDEGRWTGVSFEIDQILSLAKIREGAAIIDQGCGTGRHSLELARRGYQVVGIDRTTEFLTEAKRELKRRTSISNGYWVIFDLSDGRIPSTFVYPSSRPLVTLKPRRKNSRY